MRYIYRILAILGSIFLMLIAVAFGIVALAFEGCSTLLGWTAAFFAWLAMAGKEAHGAD